MNNDNIIVRHTCTFNGEAGRESGYMYVSPSNWPAYLDIDCVYVCVCVYILVI